MGRALGPKFMEMPKYKKEAEAGSGAWATAADGATVSPDRAQH
jgi:hypothetical protein